MQISKNQRTIAGVGLLVAAVAGAGLFYYAKAPVPVPVLPSNPLNSVVATSSDILTKQSSAVSVPPFPINTADTIATWNFKGAYTGNNVLVQQANADISKLKSLLGKGQYDDYDLYLGIGNDDNLLGDGKGAYQNYTYSISVHPNKGLAFVNLAHLMDELGAYHTAVDAYKKAVTVEPRMLEYHIERLTYLTRQFPADNALITAAFTDASKQFGDNASILAIEAEWLTGQGRYADAIKAWETVKMLSPGKDTSSIDTEIARLKAK